LAGAKLSAERSALAEEKAHLEELLQGLRDEVSALKQHENELKGELHAIEYTNKPVLLGWSMSGW
jgi:predicted nuclease with TOPRIM domain